MVIGLLNMIQLLKNRLMKIINPSRVNRISFPLFLLIFDILKIKYLKTNVIKDFSNLGFFRSVIFFRSFILFHTNIYFA